MFGKVNRSNFFRMTRQFLQGQIVYIRQVSSHFDSFLYNRARNAIKKQRGLPPLCRNYHGKLIQLMSAAGAKVRLTGCIRFSAVRTVSNRSLYIGSHRLLRHRLERLLIIRRSILVDRISLIMTQRGLALWAINKAVWIPRSEIKAEIRIPDH